MAAAVNISCLAVPGVSDGLDGETVTPAGNPDIVIVVAPPVRDDAVSRREACWPLAPAVRLRLEGVIVRVGVELGGVFIVAPPQENRPRASRLPVSAGTNRAKVRKGCIGSSGGGPP